MSEKTRLDEEIIISIVSPVYKAGNIINTLVSEVTNEIKKVTNNYEIILVEDRSPDNSWQKVEAIAQQYPNIKGIKLSNNFGQHAAIKAGLEASQGDCCIVMDCDLQDNPKYIPDLINKWIEGNEIVFTYKSKRSHSFFKNFTATIYTIIFNVLVDNKNTKSNKNIGAYSLISRKVVNAFKSYHDYQFHYLIVLKWLGFRYAYLEIEHQKRYEGKSSYSFQKLIDHAMVAIVYQSDKLLKMSIILGLVLFIISLLSAGYIIFQYFLSGFQSGWASLFVLGALSTGLMLLAIGVLGLYLGKVFEQVKNRPQYIIDKMVSSKSNK